MEKRELRQQDILKLIEGLDISPTMYKNATEKYTAVGTYLQKQGLMCDIFPQGSFSLGTVVRPYKESKEANYDLDIVCCLNESKESTTPRYVKNIVKEVLCASNVYKEKLQDEEWDKCWTLQYAEINEIGFNMDIVPAVPETDAVVQTMISSTVSQEDAKLAVAITDKRNQNYYWMTSNARAYKNWFETINRPFLEYDRLNKKRVLFEKSRDVYGSIEEIPEGLERSSLQRVIQILKHHRDVYFCRIRKEELKPTSAIITTVCSEIASSMNPSLNVFELLQAIVSEFEIYALNQSVTEEEFSRQYLTKTIIRKNKGAWRIINPVNPMDNLADAWNEEPEKAELFFKWVKVVKKDFLDSLSIEDNDFVAMLENNFGRDYVKKSIDVNAYTSVVPKVIANTPKPWRK
ncbi:MAG: nucleotidyltransferase [Roseburia sp.]|nr:nucleotidyltransferase [Roseburia sp.]